MYLDISRECPFHKKKYSMSNSQTIPCVNWFFKMQPYGKQRVDPWIQVQSTVQKNSPWIEMLHIPQVKDAFRVLHHVAWRREDLQSYLTLSPTVKPIVAQLN